MFGALIVTCESFAPASSASSWEWFTLSPSSPLPLCECNFPFHSVCGGCLCVLLLSSYFMFYGISLTSSSSSFLVFIVCTIARLTVHTVHTKLTGRANGAEETLPSARTRTIAYTRKINNENRRWWRRWRGGTDWLWDAMSGWRSTHSHSSHFFLIEWNLCNINRM